jgi:2-dehydro-3-deoxy-D-gluconate 5-dehydrogenase
VKAVAGVAEHVGAGVWCDLTGRVAIVTGGNRGIGLAIASGLSAAGATVVIAGRDAARNEAAVSSLGGTGRRSISVVADATRPEDWHTLIERTLQTFGALNILVNNAGGNLRKLPQSFSMAEWNAVLQQNLGSAFLGSQAAYPAFKAAGGGKIINLGSMLSIFGAPMMAAYGAAKGGVVQLTRSLATAWAADNIQVNALLPGWIDTELTRESRASIPDLEQRVTTRTPAKRWGRPDDLKGAAILLAGPGSDFITGVALPVDGGYSAQA